MMMWISHTNQQLLCKKQELFSLFQMMMRKPVGKIFYSMRGTAATYGLSKEEALQAITLNAAKIMGVSDKAGSIEVGKDANIVISEGDLA